MNRVTGFLKKLVSGAGREKKPTSSPEELRAAFATRYHNFKLLITANNKAHELRTDLERALEGTHVFGVSFVKSRCTALTVTIFRILKHLNELAPGKYSELTERFKVIQAQITDSLIKEEVEETGPLVLSLGEVDRDMVDLVGSKMANVAEIGNKIHLPVPSGFVVTAAAYKRFLRHGDLKAEISRRIQASEKGDIDDLFRLSSDIQHLIISSPFPEDLEQAILQAYKQVEKETGPDVKVSVRSSALGEDSAGMSFAGQFKSELNVSQETLIQAYKEVVASKYCLPAITYRLNRGIPHEDVAMCVGCMAMVEAVAGGVMYSTNPLDIRDCSIFINSVWGLPKAVVDGSVDPDVIVVNRGDPMVVAEKQIKDKPLQYICYADEGVCRMELTADKGSSQSITDEQALALAEMAVKLEEYYGSPQDIEWAVGADGSIYVLQCRPLQQFGNGTTKEIATAERSVDARVLAAGGVTAAPGVAAGPVFIVKSDVDKLRFPDGAVLVTAQSLPRWAPLLGRAAAVVTEVGGVAGHLANVAREFGVPALFGVPGATTDLVSGQEVTVDADGRTLYGGRVDSLLHCTIPKKNLMFGSPVYELLEKVAAYIVPLNLLDPDSTDFQPKNCVTLHDITRFAHEKSVSEMFNFGKEHHFAERSSKQLYYNVAMQWWIINLDDGFNEDVPGKFVLLENICSIPMLAIWDGWAAIPWEGPPAVDAKGLMSVLMQATTNPALDPAMSSPYSARNYFMISKNFCSLTSRFGFHFSTVEALVGDRPGENYISFGFKGGAADHVRRARRAGFIGGMLEEYGFRIEQNDDNIFARLEGRDEEFMKSRLKIIGYMIMHTRQLDMVMSNEAETRRYWNKFKREIGTILGDSEESAVAVEASV